MTLNELLQGLEDVEAIARSFRVDVRYNRGEDARGGRVLSFDTTYLEDASGRVRLERSETRTLKDGDGNPIKGEVAVIAAYNGTALKQMEGRGRFTLGRVGPNKGEMPWGSSPRNYFTHYFDQPVSQLIKAEKGTIVESSSDGTLTVEGRGNFVERDKSTRKFRFRVDKHFSVVDKSVLIKPDGSPKWHIYTQITSDGYRLADSGVRVPTQAVYKSLNVDDVLQGKADAPTLRYKHEFTFSNWDFSPHSDDSTFDLAFAPGVIVTDQVQGRTYKVPGRHTDDGLSRFVLRANLLANAHNASAKRRSWLLLGNAVVVVGIALAIACTRYRRLRSERLSTLVE